MTTAETARILDVDGLLAAARDKTGLSDYGDEWFVEPLKVLTAALVDEARLSELGLALTQQRLTALLADRLRLRQLQAENPAIIEEEVTVAAEICGLPRTGSTLLHRLLASSPHVTSTLSWETSYPLPFPGEGPDAEQRKQQRAGPVRDVPGDVPGLRRHPHDRVGRAGRGRHPARPHVHVDELRLVLLGADLRRLAAWLRPGAGLPGAAGVAAGAAVAGPVARTASRGC